MGINILIMKFTSVAVLALFLADSQAVLLKKDCGDVGCERHLSYAFDKPTLDAATAHNVAANQHFAGATKAAAAAAAATTFAGTSYKDPGFPAAEAANAAAVKTKEATLDAALKAEDDKVAKTLISARKDR